MRFKTASVALAAALLGTGAASAHHSTAMFDKQRKVTVEGVVTGYEWTNPHVFIELDVTERGAKAHYSIEAGDIRSMSNFGWKVRTLKPGDRLTVVMHPLRSGAKGGLIASATLSDGRTLRYEAG
jgi:hypothetical protein